MVRGIEKFVGTQFDDYFYGDKDAADTFFGGDGNDFFFGGGFADVYSGGNGADIFKFDAQNIGVKASTTNIDTIIDLQSIDKLDFTALTTAAKVTGDPTADFTTQVVLSGTMLQLVTATGVIDIALFDHNYTVTVDQLVSWDAFVF